MFAVLRAVWKSLVAAMALIGLFWLPADIVSYDQALGPWQRLWALVSRETLLWAFALTLFAWLVWTDLRPFVRGRLKRKFSPRHAAICSDLADHLSRLGSGSKDAPHWASPGHFNEAKAVQWDACLNQVDALMAQIAYDTETADAARLYARHCARIVRLALKGQPTEEIEAALDNLSGPVFQCLHTGKPVNPALLRAHQLPVGIEIETQR